MAKKNVFVHLDMNKQELQNAKAQNLTTAEVTTLAGTLVAADKGLFVYDTTLGKLFVWSGTAFENVTPAPPQVGQNRGGVAHTAAEPANLVNGDYVIFTSAGALTNFVPGEVVQIGDLAFYNGATATWDLVQGNVVMATETVAGVVQLATQLEVTTGNDTEKAVTPSTLKNTLITNFQQSSLNLVANVMSSVPLNPLKNFQDVKFYIFEAGTILVPIELEYKNNLVNSTLEVTSNINLSNVDVRITYFIN